jgi:uncharacterized protein YoxC
MCVVERTGYRISTALHIYAINRNIMELWVQIATICALLSLAALCLYVVLLLRDVRGTVRTLSSLITPAEMDGTRERIAAVLKNLEEMSHNAAIMTGQLREGLEASGSIFTELQALSQQIRNVRSYVHQSIIKPIGNLSLLFSALTKGGTAFFERMNYPRQQTAYEYTGSETGSEAVASESNQE